MLTVALKGMAELAWFRTQLPVASTVAVPRRVPAKEPMRMVMVLLGGTGAVVLPWIVHNPSRELYSALLTVIVSTIGLTVTVTVAALETNPRGFLTV